MLENGYTRAGYACGKYSYYGKKYCTSHYITVSALNQLVLDDIQRQIEFVKTDSNAREKYLARKRGLYAEQQGNDKKRLKEMGKRITELDRLIGSVYEDKVSGKMPEDMAFSLLEKYQAEKKSLSQEFVSSGNHDIDSLLNYKLMSAQQLGTEIVTDMRIPADTQIPAFDINVILGNLLDNVPHDGAPLCSHSAERLIHKYFALCLWTPQAFEKA